VGQLEGEGNKPGMPLQEVFWKISKVKKVEKIKDEIHNIAFCFSVLYICPAYKGTSNPHQLCTQVPVFCPLEKKAC
jgi:hypothetical protein